MLKSIKFFGCAFFLITQFSCQENKQNTENNSIIMRQILEKQIRNGANQYTEDRTIEMPKNSFAIEEMDANVQAVTNILDSSGFKVLSNKDFSERIKNIFHRIIDTNSQSKYLYVNYMNTCKRDFISIPNNGIEYSGTYIVKNKNFITDFFYLPQIIDYQKKYPELAKLEDSMSTNKTDKDGNKYTIELWYDLEKNEDKGYNLREVRKRNIQTIISRNKFLFNNSKADLAILLSTDKGFLSKLLILFGYDEEPALNKMVLDSLYKKYNSATPIQTEKIGSIFFMKDCNNNLQIREGLLKFADENITAKDNEIIYALSSFMGTLYIGDKNEVFENDPAKVFTEIEKANIVAHVAGIENPAFDKFKSVSPDTWNRSATGLYNLNISHPEVIEIIKNHNYFNVKNLKEIIENLYNEISN